jgi:hypothetical protein
MRVSINLVFRLAGLAVVVLVCSCNSQSAPTQVNALDTSARDAGSDATASTPTRDDGVSSANAAPDPSQEAGVISSQAAPAPNYDGISSQKTGPAPTYEGVRSQRAGPAPTYDGISSQKAGPAPTYDGISSQKAGPTPTENDGVQGLSSSNVAAGVVVGQSSLTVTQCGRLRAKVKSDVSLQPIYSLQLTLCDAQHPVGTASQ